MTLNSGQTLAGAGTVNGSVTSAAGATINPGGGVAVSTLTVSSATLGGLLLMDLNRTNTPSNCDQLAGSITYGGTLVATNIGPDLQVGDTFQLFPTAAIGFAQITLPATNSVGYIYTWSNGVAVDGSISVLAVNPPVLVSTNAYLTSLVFNPTLGFAPAFTTNGTSLLRDERLFEHADGDGDQRGSDGDEHADRERRLFGHPDQRDRQRAADLGRRLDERGGRCRWCRRTVGDDEPL